MVLLERLDQPGEVLSKGIHFVSRYDKIKGIVDLKDHITPALDEEALTKNQIHMKVKDAKFCYRIAISEADKVNLVEKGGGN